MLKENPYIGTADDAFHYAERCERHRDSLPANHPAYYEWDRETKAALIAAVYLERKES